METWLIWLIIAALLVIIELFTFLVATFCLSVGCLFAMIMSIFDLSLEMQLVGLIAGTVIAFIAFAPMIRRWQKDKEQSRGNGMASNMDALINRVVDVVEPIPAYGVGRVKVDGDRWQARCTDGSEVPAGARVRITGYDSIILDVEKI